MMARAAEFELVVGLEVHCQLRTASKIFCGCATAFGASPNRNTCPVCLGLPGALPVLNRDAVALATRASLALGCTVHPVSVFARKNYFYPDLPKGYQISQFDRPLATDGQIVLESSLGGTARIGITRVHMEEDAGKSVHDRFAGYTAIDLNRAGTPLIEIVSEPDLRSGADAGSYLRALKQILEYTDVSDANMEEGSLRVDVNISTRRRGARELGVKTEIKNLNTFSGVERAIDIEFARQVQVIAHGGSIEQQTMLYDGVRNAIRPARAKEGSHDYRYFPDPDLPPLVLTADYIEGQRRTLPELPAARRARLADAHRLSATELEAITATTALADYFERLAEHAADGKRAANWLLGPVLASLNATGSTINEYMAPERLAALLRLEASGTISNTAARQLLPMLERGDGEPRQLAQREGLLKVSDDAALEAWIDDILAAHPAEAARFLAGERKLQGVLVGLVMKRSGGSADPKKVNQMLASRVA